MNIEQIKIKFKQKSSNFSLKHFEIKTNLKNQNLQIDFKLFMFKGYLNHLETFTWYEKNFKSTENVNKNINIESPPSIFCGLLKMINIQFCGSVTNVQLDVQIDNRCLMVTKIARIQLFLKTINDSNWEFGSCIKETFCLIEESDYNPLKINEITLKMENGLHRILHINNLHIEYSPKGAKFILKLFTLAKRYEVLLNREEITGDIKVVCTQNNTFKAQVQDFKFIVLDNFNNHLLTTIKEISYLENSLPHEINYIKINEILIQSNATNLLERLNVEMKKTRASSKVLVNLSTKLTVLWNLDIQSHFYALKDEMQKFLAFKKPVDSNKEPSDCYEIEFSSNDEIIIHIVSIHPLDSVKLLTRQLNLKSCRESPAIIFFEKFELHVNDMLVLEHFKTHDNLTVLEFVTNLQTNLVFNTPWDLLVKLPILILNPNLLFKVVTVLIEIGEISQAQLQYFINILHI